MEGKIFEWLGVGGGLVVWMTIYFAVVFLGIPRIRRTRHIRLNELLIRLVKIGLPTLIGAVAGWISGNWFIGLLFFLVPLTFLTAVFLFLFALFADLVTRPPDVKEATEWR